jgi:8-oxo-dGTP diphosphatase
LRELEEETGVAAPPAAAAYVHAVNGVFPCGAHYVTIFVRVAAPADCAPELREPDKCGGWEWATLGALRGRAPLFLPLRLLLESGREV